jgi:hypothetical protein
VMHAGRMAIFGRRRPSRSGFVSWASDGQMSPDA